MNWYTLSKSAMPLPRIQNQYPDPNEGWAGIKTVDEQLPQEQADQISKEHPTLNYLGHGANGIAYEHQNPQTLIKLTRSQQEAEASAKSMNNPCPCTVKVLSVKQVAPSAWKIERERAQPLSPEDRENLGFYGKLGPDKSDERINRTMLSTEQKQHLSAFAREYDAFLKCLQDNGISDKDTKRDNLGRNQQGQIVLFDIG